MIVNAWYAFVALGALSAGLLGAVLLARWPLLIGLIVGIYVLISWDMPVVPPITTVMGTSIYFLDYFAVVLFLVSLPRVWRARSTIPALVGCWFALLFILALSLLRGLVANGMGAAVNEFRSFLYVVALLQWALTLDWTSFRRRQLIARGSLALGWALVAMFAIHVALRGLGSADESIIDAVTGELYSSRPLNSGQALMLVLCAVLSLARWLESRRTWPLVSAVAFLLCVALAQNRSTWAAAIGALVVIAFVSSASGRMRLIWVLIVGAASIALLVSAGAFGDVAGKLSESLSSSGTYDAREDSWQVLISQQFAAGDPLRVLLGSSMGDGYDRVESTGRLVQYAPHNWYVSVFLRAGLVGLVALVIMMVIPLVEAFRRRHAPAAAVIAAVLLYGWAYSWNWYLMIFLGWATLLALDLDLNKASAISTRRIGFATEVTGGVRGRYAH